MRSPLGGHESYSQEVSSSDTEAIANGIADSCALEREGEGRPPSFVMQTLNVLMDSMPFCSSGEVEEANINRSPTSYEANPEEEKAR